MDCLISRSAQCGCSCASARRSIPATDLIALRITVRSEVILSKEDGLPDTCALNFDNVQTVPKSNLGARFAHLSARKMREAAAAIAFAFGFDDG